VQELYPQDIDEDADKQDNAIRSTMRRLHSKNDSLRKCRIRYTTMLFYNKCTCHYFIFALP
jgi:hypothetical protein